MEVSVDMFQEEDRVTHCNRSFHLAQDRSIRRLQWAVAGCVLCMCAFMCLTAYKIIGGDLFYWKDKVQSEPSKSVGTSHNSVPTKPSAHLTAKHQDDLQSKDLQWETQNGLAFIQDGMKYVNKSIHIPKDGYYFVYSKVSFLSECNKMPPSSISQTISRLNGNYRDSENLLSGISFCIKETGRIQPIYLGALLDLSKGDKLKVSVSIAVNRVDISEQNTFFGVFLMYDRA